MRDFIIEFQNEIYETQAKKFIIETDKKIAKAERGIQSSFLSEIKKQWDKANKAQKGKNWPAISYASLSLLYTSVYFKRPQIRFDLYDEDWTVKEPLFTAYLDVPWLFSFWQEHYNDLQISAKELSSRITSRYIKQSMWGSVRLLAYLIAQHFKYWSHYMVDDEAFDDLNKTSEFYITVGEYINWQDIVYAKLPFIDIFNCNINDSLEQRDFNECVYQHKQFDNLNLTGSRFYKCIFEESSFKNCVLNDCTFVDCHFKHNRLDTVQAYGITVRHCLLDYNHFQKVNLGINAQTNVQELPGVYKVSEFINCSISNLRLDNCCLANTDFPDCVIKDIEKNNTDLTNTILVDKEGVA